ncbi:MAG: ABC-type transport auxiliary lipoprotein family protein [Dokdonella sp.]|jgi:cholesterol transport system auxiliary component|uniref:ABC-type transport auxiliary lipoprotein family protein n=1 Tax=Dokdonella sp. TaxID=2291710 RepID=UPI001B6D48EC|nr:ABC-type transport auxiliary lipoprotein family protein [Dokdonella sp.]MBK8123157.1 membrane integrity-associated transporter subunit PqiC [Dokdonella sp.]MBP6327295.1 membrane integrity-associated transporter subunit PqiC [Dokdonella sp.]MCC6439437.1 membrane integrity-associated transporter subunit PqiC [Rhodanobacteraceae bacterium]HPW03943.1 ABC-type transport auxiliary lipoprotein family protein [Dokdonella sp.]
MKTVFPFFLALVLAACGNVPGAPDHTFFQMAKPAALPVSEAAPFRTPIVVNLFAADGLYADRALIYALDPEARELRQYHYQLWTDPPTRQLQRRLKRMLDAASISPLVIDALPASQAALRISGTILRFERVPAPDGGSIASVALRMRVDRPDGTPQLDEIYHADAPAADSRLISTVDALSVAVDEIFASFHGDLLQSEVREHAR